MKKPMIALIFISLSASFQQAEGRTNVLQTILPPGFSVHLSSVKNLSQACERFERGVRLLNRAGNEKRISEFLESSRVVRRFDGWELEESAKFHANLEALNELASPEQKREIAGRMPSQRMQAPNPEFLLAPEQVQVAPMGLKLTEKDVQILSPDSIVGLARRLGLEASPLEMQMGPEGLDLSVYGLDLACDLVSHRVEMRTQPLLRVYVGEAELDLLKKAFGDVADIASRSFAKGGSVNAKVARSYYKVARNWSTIARDLPKAKDEDEQAMGFIGLIVNVQEGTVLSRADVERVFPEYVEVGNVPVQFEVVR